MSFSGHPHHTERDYQQLWQLPRSSARQLLAPKHRCPGHESKMPDADVVGEWPLDGLTYHQHPHIHASKPSDLIPELQGRFPIRVELKSLSKEDFERILLEPQNSLIKQYTALLKTENVKIDFTRDAVEEIASLAQQVNEQTENIGARRLHTIMEKVIEDISFEGPQLAGKKITIDRKYVQDKLKDIVKDRDLSRYIL